MYCVGKQAIPQDRLSFQKETATVSTRNSRHCPIVKSIRMKSRIVYTQTGQLSRITQEQVGGELSRVYPGLDPDSIPALTGYLNDLMHWNTKFNLTGIKDWKTVCRSLILDSLLLKDFLLELPLPPDPLCLDLGAGAGLPGIPLRIVWSSGRYILVEPQQKKVTFLTYVLSRLHLPNTAVQALRIQDLPERLQPADLVLSRAFLPWNHLLEQSASLLAPGGFLLVFSTSPWTEEQTACPDNWTFFAQREYTIPDKRKRYFWAFHCTPEPESGSLPIAARPSSPLF